MDEVIRSQRALGASLRRRRRELDLNQVEVGEKTTLRQATISGVETGAPGTRLDTLFALLAALDLELVVRPRTKGRADEIEEIF